MRKFRGLIALAISVIIGLVAARFVYYQLNRQETEKQPVQKVVQTAPEPRTLSEKIPPGMRVVRLKINDIADMPGGIHEGDVVDVLATSRIPGKDEASVSRVILQGVAVHEIGGQSGETGKLRSRSRQERAVSLLLPPDQAAVLASAAESARLRLMARGHRDTDHLQVAASAYSLSNGVEQARGPGLNAGTQPEPGMRAITLSIKDTDGILGILEPGDRVDVIVTCPYSRFASGGAMSPGAEGKVTEYQMASRTLLQNVEVLGTERMLGLPVGKKESAKRVALLVTPAQAEKLAVISDATKKGVIRLVSRNPGDSEKAATPGRILADMLAGERVYHLVDIYRGTQPTYKNFFQQTDGK